MPDEINPVVIRPATVGDAGAIARVRRASWFAAYDGIIDAGLIDRATAGGGHAGDPPPYRRTLVADAPAASVPAQPRQVVGYAAFGPERTVAPAIPLPSTWAAGRRRRPPEPAAGGPLTAAGLAGETGELYALYLHPAWWSAGLGRALMGDVLTALRADGYCHVVLWVLTGNARARRFYEKAGFTADGTANILASLGGVEELRYARALR